MCCARVNTDQRSGKIKKKRKRGRNSLEWVSVRRLLNGLEDSFVDAESDGEGESEEGYVSHHADQTEVGQR